MLEEYFEDICWCFETNSLFFAKIIRIISTKLKTRPRKIATIVVLLSCFLLTNPSTANSVSNIILFVPVFTISLFPSQNTIEFDSNDIFLYWSLYSIISIFDPLFQKSTPLYYLLKVFAISTIYLRPFQFRNILKKSVLRKIDIIGDVTERHFNRIIDKCVNITQSDQMLTAICKCDSITSKLSKKTPSSKRNTKVSSISGSSTTYEDLKRDFYSTPFNEKSTNILFKSTGDLAFSVDKYLSFAKSFTREISENVYVKNLNSLNPIIFNIKSNAPNFVSANPGRGIIEPEETLIISMTLRPFPPDFKLNSFIIVIEYNIAPIGTNNFSPQLIDGRCRKIFKLRHYL